MTPRLARLLTCAATLVAWLQAAPNAWAEPLDQAVADALNQHPTVQAALAGRDLARAEEREKYSDYFPQLNANGAAGRAYGNNSTSRGLSVTRGSGYSWDTEDNFSIHQMIFDGNETPNRVEAANARLESANINIIDVRENLALRVVLAYLDVLRTQEEVKLIQDYQKKISDYRDRIGKMVEQGGADESMAVQAHDIQNQLDSTLADVEGQLNKALAEYNEVVGHQVTDALQRPALKTEAIPADVEQAVRTAMETHPALKAARLQDEAAAHDIDADKGKLYPDVTGEVSYYHKNIDEVIGGNDTEERALLRMNWDFSTGGAQFAKIRQSRERHLQAEAQARDLQGRIEREIRKAYAEMAATKKRLDVSVDRVKVSTDLVATYEKQFEAAKVTILNMLQAENTHFNAELGQLNADYRFLAAQYSVLANLGQLQQALGIRPAADGAETVSPVALASPSGLPASAPPKPQSSENNLGSEKPLQAAAHETDIVQQGAAPATSSTGGK